MPTLRVRAGEIKYELLEAPARGEIRVPARETMQAGTRVQIELSFGPLADEILLAGIVRAWQPGHPPLARVELAGGQGHKLDYIAAVLRGGRQAAARRHRRLPSNLRVAWRSTGAQQSSRLRDISAGGAFILAADPPSVGEQIEVVLQPGSTHVSVASVVSWVHGQGEHPGFGVNFKPSDPVVAQRLTEVVRQHELALATS